MAEATQAQIRAQELLEQLWLDGDIGEKIRKAAKAKFPDAKILDDTVAPFVAPLKAENAALKERLDKMEADRAAEREAAEKHSAQTNLESALARARQDYNLTDEGFDKMVARMKETGNYADADAAAAWVASKTPARPGRRGGLRISTCSARRTRTRRWRSCIAIPSASRTTRSKSSCATPISSRGRRWASNDLLPRH